MTQHNGTTDSQPDGKESSNAESLEQFGRRSFYLLLIALSFLIISVGAFVARFHGFAWGEPDSWGTFGDFVGGVLNPLFSMLALAALVLTLRIQVEELAFSRRELSQSSKALAEQSASMKRQTFENTFFQLLRRVSEVVTELHPLGSPPGRAAFRFLRHELDRIFQESASAYDDPIEHICAAYDSFYASYHDTLGYYFRVLYHLFKFIDTSDLSQPEKTAYANIARAQL